MPRNPRPEVTRRDLIRWAASGVAASVVPFSYSQSDTNWLSFETFELKLPQWDAPGFRAVVLADFHASSPKALALALEATDLALQQKADVILMPGDFIDYADVRQLGYLRTFLKAFETAKCPVYATLGNHDYGTFRPERIIEVFSHSPVKLLRNEIVDLDGISLAGLDDGLFEKYRPDILIPGEHAKSLLTMLHEPDFVDEMPSHVSLQISGHSHGGQICLPFGVALHTPVGAWRYIDGFYPDAKAPLFVTRGIGVSGMPYERFRLFCRPQVAVLTLNPA